MSGLETWAIVAIVGMSLAAVTTAIAVPVSANAKNNQIKYQQQVAEQQAEISRQNAKMAQDQAEAKALQVENEARRRRASAMVQMAGTGTEISGNFLDVIGQSAANQEFDVLNTKYQGQLAGRQQNLNAATSMNQIGLLETQMQNPWLEGTLATGKSVGGSMMSLGASGMLPTGTGSTGITGFGSSTGLA
jgi:hypothetical protein